MVDDENNFDEVRDALDGGLADGLVELHTETLNRLDSNMRSGKDALGRKWAPLKESTVRAKGHSTPMIETTTLLSTIHRDSEVDRDQLSAIIGTNSIYAPPHEFGWPEAGIPRRPFIGPAGIYAENRSVDVIGIEIDTRLESAEL